jgi:hypothetical protein
MVAPANSQGKGEGRAANVAFTLPLLLAVFAFLPLHAAAQVAGPLSPEEVRAAMENIAAPKNFDAFRPQPKQPDPFGPMVEERRLTEKFSEESRSAQSSLKRGDVSQNRLNLFRVGSELPKGHGLFLDDKHRVKLYEDDGWIVMALEKRERAPGGPFEYFNPDTPESDVAIRYNDEYELLRLGAEVMAPAPPNYIRNPGRRYRITIEGLGVAPYYRTQFEVDAANALDAVATEIHHMAYMGKGMEIPAIEFGGLLAMRALNESGHLPARIPLTVLRSKVGQIRIQGQYFERGGKLLRLPRFGNVSSGQVYNHTMPKQNNPLKQKPNLVHGPTYRRGQGESQFEPLRVQLKPFQPEKSLIPKDIRANQFADLGSEREAQERFVARVRPLTQPESKMETAILRADRGTAELLGGGESQNPLEARASRFDDTGVYSGVSASPGRRSGIARAGYSR